MSVTAFLHDLASRNIRVLLRGDRLHLSAAAGIITEQLREEIGARKGEIIAFLKETRPERETDIVLRSAPRGGHLPLSFAQQRLWFLHKLTPDDPVYNLGASVRVPSAVDETILERCLQEMARRHEILRTVFEEVDGAPSQVVTDTFPTLHTVDLSHLPEDRAITEMARIREEEVQRPFDLARAPAFRALLIRQSSESALIVLVIHHILADGWSLGLLVQEIGTLYDAFHHGRVSELAELPWQYADYAYSEQAWFAEADQSEHVNYWKDKLSGTLSSLDLPIDRPREKVLSSRGGAHGFTIPAALAARLRALSRASGVTVFTTLLTIYKTLLYRYSGNSDILVGTAVSNRKSVELESLIGMFVSTLVLRTDLSRDPSVRALLKRVHDTVLDAHEHQDYPFEKLMDLTHAERSLSHSPLFQAAFVLHNTPLHSAYDSLGSGSMFELSLYVWDGSADMRASLEYNADLFDADTAARMAGHFLTLAEAVAANPDQPISQLPLLTPSECVQLLQTWNHTEAGYAIDECVHALIEQRVDATPNAVALIAPMTEGVEPPVRVSYADLDRRANQLAHRLRKLGVGPDSLVGISLDRSVELVVAVLGVWKAGGAYVPLDPAYPSERLSFMIQDAGIAAMITRKSVSAAIPAVACPVIDVDLDRQPISNEPRTRPTSTSQAHNLAYVIYTSGSTGKPKGVMIEHRSVVNLLKSMQREPGLTAADRLLSVTTLSFDIAVLEICLPLITGAAVVLADRATAMNGELLARRIQESGATVMQATPVTWRLLIESGWRAGSNLRIISGGEALPRHLADGLLATGAELWNGYGPTETTIYSTVHRVEPACNPIPIGRPIANTQLYILDEQRQPTPINVAGELYIGGAGVARGYHARPELTAERFVENPFVHDAGSNARLYRTGDQVRYRADGTVEYLGRLDNQVKVRGFRIELGEIESVLATHPLVEHAVVVAYEESPGDQRMIGYLIGSRGETADSLELRSWLADLLPQYMIPSAFVFVDAFPHTPNGKVDRRALLGRGVGTRQLSSSSMPPRPGLESLVAQVWRDTLGVQQVMADDNFFELGGNSLLGVRLLANLEKVVGQRLPVSVLFEGQTVRAMAAALGQDTGDDASSLAVRIKSGDDRPPLFIVPGINGNVIGYETLAQALGEKQPVYGLRSVGLNGEAEPLDRVDAIAAHLLRDMRSVQPHGPYYLSGFCVGGIVAYEIAQRLTADGEHVELLAMVGTWPPSAVEGHVSTSQSVQKLSFLRDGAARHVRAMWRQPRGKRLAYLRTKAGILLEMVAHRDVYRGDTETLHHELISRTNRRAAARYSPVSYSGNALLVIPDGIPMPPESDPRLEWRALVQGQCTVVRLPGNDSGLLLKPPYMQALADVLLERLPDSALAVNSL